MTRDRVYWVTDLSLVVSHVLLCLRHRTRIRKFLTDTPWQMKQLYKQAKLAAKGLLRRVSRQSAPEFNTLCAAMQDGTSSLFAPLQVALAVLIKISLPLEDKFNAKQELATLRARFSGLTAIAEVSTKEDATAQDGELRDLLHAIGVVVLLTGDTLLTGANDMMRDRTQQPVQVFGEIRGLLKLLAQLLYIFACDVSLPPKERLIRVRQHLSSNASRGAGSGGGPANIINNNSNNNYIVGGGPVTNNNWAINMINLVKEQAVEKITTVLGDRFVSEAADDTQPSASGCMSGTRTHILFKFVQWTVSDPRRIYWLAGMAGTGKTSIALTLCRRLRNESGVFFGGGFFCSRSSGFVAQTDVRRILPTLARLMAGISTEFATALMVELSKADRVASKPVRDQIGPLLLQPLSALPEMSVPIVFVIDALDEIADESELAELLELIANFQSVVPLKFILTSRPEMHIRGTSISSPEHNTILRLHEIDSDEVQQDIRTYIDRTLAHTVTGSSWYTSAQVNALVELSNCLFIFASTILKYVLAPGVDAARSVRLSRATSAVSQGTAATATLDKMYQWIVIEASHSDTIDAEELEDLKLILACILTSRSPLTVQALADLMKLEPDILRSSLGRLYAVIYVPEDDVAPGLRAVHASFSDYLFDRAPHHIRIARSLGHETLASACLHLMDQQLHFNISQSQSSYEPNPSTRPDNIPVSLEYACLHWPHHVAAISKPHGYFGWTHSAIYRDIDLKFRPKFLFWLEVLSVLHKVGLAAGLLLIAASAIQGHSITQFLHDAHSFVASSHEAIERSAPHIYLSALPFADKSSLVFQQFFPRHTGLITVEAFGIDRHGGRAVMTLTGHSGAVHSVSYSCDGRLLASGSLDGTVRVWDTRTGGEALAPLRSGDGSVLSVNFASNNKWIASGTEDRIVCIWTVTPAHVSPRRLRGHSGAVSAVVFSPDGSRLASASEDTTARLWDPEKGNRLAVVLAHTDCVYGLAFSPDGMVLASASHHSSVRFWNSINGQAVGDPLDRAGAVNLDFSQDGHLIAGSFDDGVALWRWETSEMIAELPADNKTYSVRFSHDDRQLVAASGWGFRLWTLCTDQHGTSWVDLGGHSGQVHSVTFSPDGLYIASASDDCTIRIWTAGSNQSAVQPLSAHSSPVNSVIISFDGAIIVSGSDDGLVRVWNAQTGQAALPPLHGHTGQVNSVAISANGRLIASASTDCSVRLWDAQSGAVVGNPMRHISSVTSVTFTPDGCWIASASVNNVPYLWDITEQPAPALGPLRYHAQASVIAFSLTGKLIAAGDSSGYIHIWNVDTGCLTCRLLHQYSVHSLAFSPGGMRIVSGRENATADMWEVGTGRQMHVLRGHTDTVRSVSWSLDDQFIATGSDDHSVRLWDAMTGAPLATLRGHDGRVNSVTFTPDGQSIVSVSYHSAIRKWDVFKACRLDSERAGKPFAVFTSATFNDGWLVGSSGELYLWVPAEYRKYLQSTPCVLQISRSRVVISSGHSGLHAGSN